MEPDHSPTSNAWLDASLTRALSDVILGGVLLGAAAAALLGADDVGGWSRVGPGFFPSGVGKLLGAVGLILIVRGALVGTPPPPRWPLFALAIVVAVIAALNLAAWVWGSEVSALALLFGPAEFTMQMVEGAARPRRRPPPSTRNWMAHRLALTCYNGMRHESPSQFLRPQPAAPCFLADGERAFEFHRHGKAFLQRSWADHHGGKSASLRWRFGPKLNWPLRSLRLAPDCSWARYCV